MLEILNTFVEHLYYETSSAYAGYPPCMFCNLNMDIINIQKNNNNKKSETQAGLQTAEHLIFTKNRKL